MSPRTRQQVRQHAARFLAEARRTRDRYENGGRATSWRVFDRAATLAALEATYFLHRSRDADNRRPHDLGDAVTLAAAWSLLDALAVRALRTASTRNGGAS